jgi:hypothetical protein
MRSAGLLSAKIAYALMPKLLPPVFVVQTAQHSFATHSVARRKPASMLRVGR